jgi:hypothetical protein
VRVGEQQPQQLAPGVARGPDNRGGKGSCQPG